MMPAILVSTILGVIRSMEAFEIELLLGIPIGLFVYSTKIRDMVSYEPPEYAPATALGTMFLVVLLALVAFQRWYVGDSVLNKGQGLVDCPDGFTREERFRIYVLGLLFSPFSAGGVGLDPSAR